MKSAISVLFTIIGISNAFAGDIVVRSFSVNSSFPNPEYLLKQEQPKFEGKEGRVPYMICGILTEKHVLEYAGPSGDSQKTSKSRTILPNGGIAEVTIIKEETSEGTTQLESKIKLIGPDSIRGDVTITTYDGDGILIRCDTNEKSDPQLIILQIKKEG